MQKNQRHKPSPARGKGRAALSAQQTVPYLEMLKDGVCRVRDGYYTKTIAYEDINYSVASTEDQAAIFSGWCSFLNYFDSALPFQLSFVNHRSRGGGRYKVNIPMAHDEFDSIRGEYVDMLKRQIARSNNGIVRSKYITFGAPADNLAAARPRLERVEADIMGNFKRLGVQSHVLNGWERLEALHGQLHPGGREPFRFSWGDIPKTGMGTKDFIVPDSFDFRQSRTFRVGQSWGAASFLQIMASELSDKLLLELLELDAEMTVTLHVQTVDQTKAIKTVKGKISDIDKMKVEEQRKATRGGAPGRPAIAQRADVPAHVPSGEYRPHAGAAGKRGVHRVRHRPKAQLHPPAAGLAAGAGLYVLPPPGLERHRDTAGYDNQLHGDFYSLYDKGAADGRAGPLLRHERPFQQRHHG